MNMSFWAGRRVFMTGHTGFKGGWLSLWLQQAGARVTGFSLPAPTHPSLFEVAQVGGGMVSHIGDIRDAVALSRALREAEPEVVFHLAAQPLVRYSYVDPVATFSTNVLGTAHLLEAVRVADSVRAVVVVTSDKCYENREWPWGYRENEPMGGFDPYASSKGCTELVAASYRSSFFPVDDFARHRVALATARAGNVIGGGDWAADRLVPDILKAFAEGRPVKVRNPHAIRPWQHVLEPLSGYLMLAQRLVEDGPRHAQAWNFGPNDDDARPVDWIADRMCAAWGGSASWERDAQPGPHEAHYLKLDCSKARALLAWRPRWRLEEALARIVDWHRMLGRGEPMQRATLAQIAQYQTSTAE